MKSLKELIEEQKAIRKLAEEKIEDRKRLRKYDAYINLLKELDRFKEEFYDDENHMVFIDGEMKDNFEHALFNR